MSVLLLPISLFIFINWYVYGGGLVTKLCPTLYDPMDCSLPGSSVHGISQARILEWVAICFYRCLCVCVTKFVILAIFKCTIQWYYICNVVQPLPLSISNFFSLPQSEILNPLNNNFPFFPPTLYYHICDKENGGT